MSDGTLVRVQLAFERDFTQIPNEWLRDNTLSLRARGLLALLMSHKAGYSVTHKSLAATNPEGLTAIQGAVIELRAAGYLEVRKERGRGGRIDGWTWILCDPAQKKSRSLPELDLPDLDNPALAQPDVDNRHLKEAQLQEHSLTNDLVTTPSTRAGDKKDALSGDDLHASAETPLERYERLIHEKCSGLPGARRLHEWAASGYCNWCGAAQPSAAPSEIGATA